LSDISEWFGIARHLASRYNLEWQEGLGALSFGWSSCSRTGTYLMNVYSIFKVREGVCFVPQ
ncbi:MAG: hypothetical protein MRZ99_05900, partial [Clostridiales bacterium]|nr:hypothetical protein [Clostridiales bacterium]